MRSIIDRASFNKLTNAEKESLLSERGEHYEKRVWYGIVELNYHLLNDFVVEVARPVNKEIDMVQIDALDWETARYRLGRK